MTAIAMGRNEIVESVYANRGVGRGEISFGRSDIDLSMIVRTPDPNSGDGPELYSLYKTVHALRRMNPAFTHLMVYDGPGYDRWMRTDTYMGSQERRSMILLTGKAVPMPILPVRREDAIRWIPFWNDKFLPLAIRQNKQRTLGKLAIETWKAWAVALGIIDEPYRTLREAEQSARAHPVGSALAEAVARPKHTVEFIMKLSGLLHDELFPPLEKLKEPIVCRMHVLPRSRWRVLVILPRPETELPAAAFEAQSLVATPEFLHLYVHYFSPFLDWTLPPEIRALGFCAPKLNEFVRACLFHMQDNTLRLPGFLTKDVWMPHSVLSVNQHCISHLRNGELPPPISEEDLRKLREHNPACSEYYLRDFAQIYKRSIEQFSILKQLQ